MIKNLLSNVGFRRVLVIFVVGLVLRVGLNYVYDLNMFKDYSNIISLAYYGLMISFSGLVFDLSKVSVSDIKSLKETIIMVISHCFMENDKDKISLGVDMSNKNIENKDIPKDVLAVKQDSSDVSVGKNIPVSETHNVMDRSTVSRVYFIEGESVNINELFKDRNVEWVDYNIRFQRGKIISGRRIENPNFIGNNVENEVSTRLNNIRSGDERSFSNFGSFDPSVPISKRIAVSRVSFISENSYHLRSLFKDKNVRWVDISGMQCTNNNFWRKES